MISWSPAFMLSGKAQPKGWTPTVRRIIIALSLAACTWLSLPKPSLYPEHTTFSRVLEDRNGRIVNIALTADEKYRLFTHLEKLAPDLITATLAHEDKHYYTHPGVNPLSIMRSVWGVVTQSARGGGSTITMQYARLRFGLRTRSWSGKVVQMFLAVQLERHYSKHDILEAYLNLAPYGGNVEGAGAAGLLWCGKAADTLNRRESVALAVLPQSPTRRSPSQAGENKALSTAQHRLLQRLQSEHGWRVDPLDAAYTLRPDVRLLREAPHLARRLFKSGTGLQPVGNSGILPELETENGQNGSVTHTTLDIIKQRIIERSLNDYISRKRDVGIRNASALLIHAPSREVIAYIGSAGFLDAGIQGQVDGVTARRSPGSALKPFVYALAMQQGLIHPRSLLKDTRLSFGEYNPENFDREFSGPIAAEDALYRSRNIPAVSLAHDLAQPGLYGFLKTAGVALPRGEEFYGLSLALGGGEVSMEELGVLYSMLAHDGCARPLKFRGEGILPSASEKGQDALATLLTPEACFLTRRMLKPREGEAIADDNAVSWKTGTSHGFRDAWAAGIRGDYVLIVWIGNFNGHANHAFIARECAAPLLFETFHKLRLPARREAPPSAVDEVELCAVSGQLPTPHCQHRLHGWFIPGVSPITPCEIHREVLIDADSGLRLVTDDGREGLQHRVFEFWPPDLMELFRQAGLPRSEPPRLEPSGKTLNSAGRREAPKIASPRHALVYTLRAHDAQRQTIPLRAETAPGVRTVYWFAGKQYLGSSAPVQPLMWHAGAGLWKLQVLDDHGRFASCEVRVEMVE
jgi:penicillin-binding protein 1C